MNELITIAPHSWTGQRGEKNSADCYPFVSGKPFPQIADCRFCTKFVEGGDICNGWKDEPHNAPLFCGPICDRFDPNEIALEILEETAQ